MSRVKIVLLSSAAMCVAIAMAANSASALEDRYYEPTKTEIKSAKMEGEAEVMRLQSSVAGTEVLVEGTKGMLKEGEIESEGKSKAKLVFEKPTLDSIKEGTLESLAACTVSSIEVKFKGKLVTETAEVVGEEIESSIAEKPLTEFTVSGSSCALKGTYKLEGADRGSLEGKGELAELEHVVSFGQIGSKLKVNKEPASYTSTMTMKLNSKKEWYAN